LAALDLDIFTAIPGVKIIIIKSKKYEYLKNSLLASRI